jgi:thioredoxin-dependent peroxiredoxin
MKPGARESASESVSDFPATTHTGEQVSLRDLLTRGPVVLFFYPKAHTPGCTIEACHFRDLQAEFDALGAQCVGVSRDPVDVQASFAERHGLSFPLLSDPDGAIARLFGAKRNGRFWHRRRTVVIGTDGEVLGRIDSETSPRKHSEEALSLLRQATLLHAMTTGPSTTSRSARSRSG